MRNRDNLIYIADRCYQRQSLLLDVEVIDRLQHNKLSVTEQINQILRKELGLDQ